MIYVELAVVAALILANGVLAMSELAVVSARRARLQAMAGQGVRGATHALRLAGDPGRFLSTVQIGITMVGILAGAFSGSTLGQRLGAWFEGAGMSAASASTLGVGLVVAVITYCTLIVGELVPKQLALRHAEAISVRIAPVMLAMSRLGAPVVWLLDRSGKAVMRMLGQGNVVETKVTDEEISALIAEAESHGVIEAEERQMISGVMRLGDRCADAIMTPREQVDWIDIGADAASTRRALIETQHSHMPAGEGSSQNMVGVIRTRDLLSAMLANETYEPGGFVRPAPIVDERADALEVLSVLKEADVPLALVRDREGAFAGVVTPADILKAIAGVFGPVAHDGEPPAVRRDDGSWLLAGSMNMAEVAAELHIDPGAGNGEESLAQFVMTAMRRLPATGESFEAMGWRFEVVDLDGRRIDKVLATKIVPRAR